MLPDLRSHVARLRSHCRGRRDTGAVCKVGRVTAPSAERVRSANDTGLQLDHCGSHIRKGTQAPPGGRHKEEEEFDTVVFRL